MAIIPGIEISIPPAPTRAGFIIKRMVQLLEDRHQYKISRRGFLTRWGQLRTALFLTDEYQAFRRRVLERCGHVCEFCHEAAAVHVHHTKQLSFYPHLALYAPLAMGACRPCHGEEHDG